MKRILIKVSYRDNTNRFWRLSRLALDIVSIDMSNVHNEIARLCSDMDCVEFVRNNKPISPMYRDQPDGSAKQVGFVYRCKDEIDGKTARFDVWVEMYEVSDIDYSQIK